MDTVLKIFWLPICILGVFFSQLFLLLLFVYWLYRIGLTPLKHIFTVLFGTEAEVMKLDKSQGGIYDFKNTKTCYRKADRIAQKYISTGSVEEQIVKKGRTYKVQY